MLKLIKVNLDLGGGTLLQVANRSHTQMMSYVIDCPDGSVVVIDGGNANEDSDHLYSLLCERGKTVDLWFITHAHSDHLGALTKMMERADFDIEICKLCYCFPSLEWLSKREDFEINRRFLEQVEQHQIHVITPTAGDSVLCGSMSFEILSVPQEADWDKYTDINSSGIILLVHFPKRDVLFLGDMHYEAQGDVLRQTDASKLRCDIVQMAHHGQNGVDRSFYELIRPKVCLYTAPDWLWENVIYKDGQPQPGPWKTLETRRWMEELGVEASYSFADGDCLFQ